MAHHPASTVGATDSQDGRRSTEDDAASGRPETSSGRPKVAIVFYETYLGCAPSLINATRSLEEHGYHVDILIRDTHDGFVDPPQFGPHVQIKRLGSSHSGSSHSDSPAATEPDATPSLSPSDSVYQHPVVRWLKDRMTVDQRQRAIRVVGRTVDSLRSLRPSVFLSETRFASAAAAEADGQSYVAIFGVDTNGLIAAHQISVGSNTPVIYWSLEIMFLRDFWTPLARFRKRRERQLHQRSTALVIQDTERQQALCDENHAWDCPSILVPNSPRGFLREQDRSDYFRDRFELPKSTRVILHAGSVCDGMRSPELAAAAGEWPESNRLIFHGHSAMDPNNQYEQRLVELGRGRVLLSTDPVDYDQLDRLYSAATIGIVIYDNSLGPNFQLLAGASGKLAHLLRCGVPVISVRNPSIGRVLNDYQCGIDIDQLEQTGTAIESICENYDAFRANALTCYREAYEFDKHFQPVLDLLDKSRSIA